MHIYHEVEQVLCVYFSAPLRADQWTSLGFNLEAQLCCFVLCILATQQSFFKRLMCNNIFHM